MSDLDSDSDDSFLEKHMDQYISSKPKPESPSSPKIEASESSDDSYLENYINQMDNKKNGTRFRGTTVTQDYDNLPEVYKPTKKLFTNFGLSSDDEEETNREEDANTYTYDNYANTDCLELLVPFNSTTIDTLIYHTN